VLFGPWTRQIRQLMYLAEEILSFQVQYLSRPTFQGATHQQHLPARVPASQQPAFVETMTKRLGAEGNAFCSGEPLRYFVTDVRFQKDVVGHNPADTHSLSQPASISAVPTTGAIKRPRSRGHVDISVKDSACCFSEAER
jgi:hypothetical protein